MVSAPSGAPPGPCDPDPVLVPQRLRRARADGARGGARPARRLRRPGQRPRAAPHPAQHLMHTVFTGSYVDAMRITLVIPAALLLLCAASCALLLRPRPGAVPVDPPPS